MSLNLQFLGQEGHVPVMELQRRYLQYALSAFINILKSLYLQKCQWTNIIFLDLPRKLTVPGERNISHALKKLYWEQLSPQQKQLKWNEVVNIWALDRLLGVWTRMDTSTDRQEKRAPVTARQNTAITFCQKNPLPLLKETSGNLALDFIFMVSVLPTKQTLMLRQEQQVQEHGTKPTKDLAIQQKKKRREWW